MYDTVFRRVNKGLGGRKSEDLEKTVPLYSLIADLFSCDPNLS